jgi:hypothetical protein
MEMESVKLETVKGLLDGIDMEKVHIGGFPGQVRFVVTAEDPIQTRKLMELVSLIPNMVQALEELGKSQDECSASTGEATAPEAFTRVEIKLPGKVEPYELMWETHNVAQALGEGCGGGKLNLKNGEGDWILRLP